MASFDKFGNLTSEKDFPIGRIDKFGNISLNGSNATLHTDQFGNILNGTKPTGLTIDQKFGTILKSNGLPAGKSDFDEIK